MHNIGTFKSFDDAYSTLVEYVKLNGELISPRGQYSYEVRPATFTIQDPRRAVYTGKRRRLNYRFMAIETLGYLAGAGDVEYAKLLISSNKNIGAYLNRSTGVFDGAYGPRLIQSLEDIVELLARDPDTRQAVASIWSPGIPRDSLDVPCTVALHFMRVNGRLDLSVYMRSNDLNWGTPYDVAAFCVIQQAVAKALKIDVGEYHHTAGSLHVYEESMPKLGDDDCSHRSFEPYKMLDLNGLSPGRSMRMIIDDSRFLINELVVHMNDVETAEGYVYTQERPTADFSFFRSSAEDNDPSIANWCHLIRGSKP